MLKLAGRRVYFAALAVPIAMVIAPLNASAGVPDEAVVTEEVPAAAIATDEGATEASNVMTDPYEEGDDVDEVVFAPGPDWYEYEHDETNVNYDPDDDTNVVYVINGIHDDGVIGNHENDEHDETVNAEEVTYFNDDEDAYEDADEYSGVDTGHDVNVVEDEDDVYILEGDDDNTYVLEGHDDHYVVEGDDDDEWNEEGGYAVSYEDVTSGAGPEGAWVSSTEAGAITDSGDYGHDFDGDNVEGSYYEEVTAGAGNEGAFVDSVESAAGEFGDDFDDEMAAYHEKVSAYAGIEGAGTDSTESSVVELD